MEKKIAELFEWALLISNFKNYTHLKIMSDDSFIIKSTNLNPIPLFKLTFEFR